MSNEHNIYIFKHKKNSFEIDEKNLTALKNAKDLDLTRQQFEILLQFVKNPDSFISRTQFSIQIWKETGVSDETLNKEISLIRKKLGDQRNEIISTIPKSRNNQSNDGGYKFKVAVELKKPEKCPEIKKEVEILLTETKISPIAENETDLLEPENNHQKTKFYNFFSLNYVLYLIALFALLVIGIVWMLFYESNEDEIRRVVKDSQFYESLVLYKNPLSFSEKDLDKYWTPELDINSNSDRQKIRDAIASLLKENKKYGDETKCEKFEFESIELNKDTNFATVRTLEKWLVAVYGGDGTLQKNKTVGPYFVSYIVRKIDGRWLIEKSNTGRMNRPIPRIFDIEVLSEAASELQFFIKLNGQDFEAENLYLEVFGEGCPESNPCKVTNNLLRENSKITEKIVDKIPLTLKAGYFKIIAHNGDSKASNPVYLNVP
jgi:DNA-binding winged helix-turn-helix (wHTH) protein